MERRKFTREFKLEAVRIKERGVPYAQASQDLGVHPSQLRDWVKKFAEDANQAFPGNGQIAWLTRPRSQRSRSDEELGAKVRASFVASDRTYGTRRVWKDMLAEGGYRAVCIGLSG